MKISKKQLKQIIMREFRNLNETGKKKDGESTGDKGKGEHRDEEDYEDGGDRKGDKPADKDRENKRDYEKNEARLREDSSEEEEAHDDADIDRLRRIRDDLNDHIRNLEDQHDRAKRHGERDD